MARMLHQRGKPADGQKVFIAVAAYEGCGAGFTYALFHTGAALAAAGIAHELAIYSGNCHVDDSRNRLVRDFLNSDCTDLIFLDVDVGWLAADFVKMLRYDRDVVAGIYPKKHGDDTYPVRTLPGEIWSDADGLIEVEGAPTGFLRIRRSVLEQLAKAAVYYNARNDAPSAIPLIFERQVHDGIRWGGDYVFCKKWREAGGRIFIDPALRFEHSGEHTWTGSVGAWLRQRAGIGLVHGLRQVRAGVETVEDLMDLFDAWDNPFAATPELLAGLAMLARSANGPILECGGGLSSLVLAAANPNIQIVALEDSSVFAEHLSETAARHGLDNLQVISRPLRDGWYDMEGINRAGWAVVLVDGPRRTTGSRADAPRHLDLSRSIVVADDIQDDGGVPALKRALSSTHDVIVVDGPRKSFAICAPKPTANTQARAA